MRRARLLFAGFVLHLGAWASPILAQCAMCQTSVSGSSQAKDVAPVLNTAILTLLIPSIAILSAVFWFAFTSRDHKESGAERKDPTA